jgi:hypothetical protein
MRKNFHSDKASERDWHYYLTQEAAKENWKANKKWYVGFCIIVFLLMISIALLNRYFGG